MRNTRILSCVFAGIVIALAGVVATPPRAAQASGNVGATDVPFTTVDGGLISGFGGYCGEPLNSPPPVQTGSYCHAAVAEPAFESVIREKCAWESLWNGHVSITYPQPPAPDVDFDKYVVVAVISGPRPDGCYGIAVDRITLDARQVTIHVVEGVPCPGTPCPAVVSNPFHFVLVPARYVQARVIVAFDHRFNG